MNNSLFQLKKIYWFVIALILATTVLLVAAKNARATLQIELEELAGIKNDVFPVAVQAQGPSQLEELAQIKDELLPAAARATGSSRLEELAQIKGDVFAADARPTGSSRLEELAQIKGDVLP